MRSRSWRDTLPERIRRSRACGLLLTFRFPTLFVVKLRNGWAWEVVSGRTRILYSMPNFVKTEPYIEPWLSGSHGDVPAAGRAVLHALELAWDDLRKWTEGLTDDEVHAEPFGVTPLAFHLRHIAGSVDRILTYAEGGELSTEQFAALKAEKVADRKTLEALLGGVEAAFAQAAGRISALAGVDLNTPRSVGRKQLPTSVGGALIHVADHTLRHTGQVVTTAKLLKGMREGQVSEGRAGVEKRLKTE